jgi:tRNA(Ile)-lysidine synthase
VGTAWPSGGAEIKHSAASAPDIPDLAAAVGCVLDRRLRPSAAAPLAVALSGGGDSLALTLTAAVWAKAAGRPLVVLTVDHCLRPESARWTQDCAATAARLGAGFRALPWTGEKPTAGLPAAARAARHRLIADAARAAGARVILMGHTADDVGEARRMRALGSTTPEPREWTPSPAWPQGRGVFLLRPLLALARADLRAWLTARGEAWIDDPANDDQRYARARARRDQGPIPPPPPETPDAAPLASAAQPTLEGGLAISRDALRAAEPVAARRFLAAACLCAAGTDRPPTAERVERLLGRIAHPGPVTTTLAGARIEADARSIRILREAGEAARGGLAPLHLAPGETGVWDGRFEIATERPADIRRLAGLAVRLPRDQLARLQTLPPAARLGLPALVENGRVFCPLLAEVPRVRLTPLAHPRLLAACGAVDREPA